MEQYIDKSALVAEIERRQDRITKGIFNIPLTGRDRASATLEYEILGKIKEFLDHLEVKEVDLKKPFEGISVKTTFDENNNLDVIKVTTEYKKNK